MDERFGRGGKAAGMARVKQTTIDGLALPMSGRDNVPVGRDAPAFRIPVRRSLRMHRKLAFGVGLLVLVALLGYALTRKPVYRAESRVYVEPIPTRVLGDPGTGNFDMARYESFLQEQMETVTRPDILLAAVRSMPVGVWQQPGETAEAAAARLGAALKTERVSTSYQLAISVGAANPEAAAAAANAVTRAYLDAGQKDSKALSAGRLELLTEERQRIADEMQAMRAEQASLGASLGVANPNGVGGDSYDAELQNVRGELASARQAHDIAAAQLAALTGPGGQHAAGTVATAEEAVASDPAISSMRIAINQRRATLIAQMNGMKPANPVYQEDQAELARLDQQLAGMTTSLQAQVEQRMEAKLRQELQRTGDVEARLNGEVSRDTALATSAGPKLQRTGELTTDLARLETRYAAVDDLVRGLQLETNGPGMAHLAVAASVPGAPEPSKSRLVLILALPLALLMGVGAAVIARRMDARIYTAGDVEQTLGFAPVGVLPERSEVSDGVTEEYLLRLAAGLEAAYRRAGARSFVFTAASASSLIDAEVEAARRKLEELGFAVTVLPAEQVLRPVGEAAGAGEREGFALAHLESLKGEFDLLLIGAHPLLHSAEAEYAVRSADAVILVVESGVTTGQELQGAAVLLRRLQASGVGTLLRGVTLRHAEPEFRRSLEVLEGRAIPGRAVPSRVEKERTVAADAGAVDQPSAGGSRGGLGDLPVVEPDADAPEVMHPVASAPAVAEAALGEPVAVDEQRTAFQPVVVGQELRLVPVEAEDDMPKPGLLARCLQNFRKETMSILPDDGEEMSAERPEASPPTFAAPLKVRLPASAIEAETSRMDSETVAKPSVARVAGGSRVAGRTVANDEEPPRSLRVADASAASPELSAEPKAEVLTGQPRADELWPALPVATAPETKITTDVPAEELPEVSAPVRRWGPMTDRRPLVLVGVAERVELQPTDPVPLEQLEQHEPMQPLELPEPAAAVQPAAGLSPKSWVTSTANRLVIFQERKAEAEDAPSQGSKLPENVPADPSARSEETVDERARTGPAPRQAPKTWRMEDQELGRSQELPVLAAAFETGSIQMREKGAATAGTARSWAALSRFNVLRADESEEETTASGARARAPRGLRG